MRQTELDRSVLWCGPLLPAYTRTVSVMVKARLGKRPANAYIDLRSCLYSTLHLDCNPPHVFDNQLGTPS